MSDPLERFRDRGENLDEQAGTGQQHALLLFGYAGVAYGVPATSVDAVITWLKPAPLPASAPGFAGVVQDRGRIVAVLSSPLGRPAVESSSPRRIVICRTTRGFIGLPCDETREVGPVTLPGEPVAGEIADSSAGPVIYLDAELLVGELRGAAGEPSATG